MGNKARRAKRWEDAAIVAESLATLIGYMAAIAGALIVIHAAATVAGFI